MTETRRRPHAALLFAIQGPSPVPEASDGVHGSVPRDEVLGSKDHDLGHHHGHHGGGAGPQHVDEFHRTTRVSFGYWEGRGKG